jgi:hypothetical protein
LQPWKRKTRVIIARPTPLSTLELFIGFLSSSIGNGLAAPGGRLIIFGNKNNLLTGGKDRAIPENADDIETAREGTVKTLLLAVS